MTFPSFLILHPSHQSLSYSNHRSSQQALLGSPWSSWLLSSNTCNYIKHTTSKYRSNGYLLPWGRDCISIWASYSKPWSDRLWVDQKRRCTRNRQDVESLHGCQLLLVSHLSFFLPFWAAHVPLSPTWILGLTVYLFPCFYFSVMINR